MLFNIAISLVKVYVVVGKKPELNICKLSISLSLSFRLSVSLFPSLCLSLFPSLCLSLSISLSLSLHLSSQRLSQVGVVALIVAGLFMFTFHSTTFDLEGFILVSTPKYTHSLIHSYTHTLVHAYTHTLVHAYTHTLIHTYTHTHIHLPVTIHRCILHSLTTTNNTVVHVHVYTYTRVVYV